MDHASFANSPAEFQLLRAAKLGHNKVVKKALDKGTQVNVFGDEKQTPLLLAARSGHYKTAKVLLDAGANIEARNSSGQTPLISASSIKLDELVKRLQAWANKKEPSDHHEKLMELLLDGGADVNARDNNNRTALYMAAQRGPKAMKLLLDAGAEVNAQDHRGETPLHQAVLFDRKDAIPLLLDAGADATIVNRNGETPEDRAYGEVKDILVAHRERLQLRQVAGIDENAQEAPTQRRKM